MGLAGKIKNSSGAAPPSTTPYQPASQPQQHADPYQQASSSPVYAYPPSSQQPLGSPDSRYGAPPPSSYSYPKQTPADGSYGAPPSSYDYPQQTPGGSYGAPPSSYGYPQQSSDGRYGAPPSSYGYPQQSSDGKYGAPPSPYGYPQQSHHNTAPSAPPLTAGTPQSYGDGYPSYREQPDQSRRESVAGSGPYGTQGYPAPYPGQGYAEPGKPPSSAYGMPSSHTPSSAMASSNYKQQGSGMGPLTQKLQAIIQANGLQTFYDQARFQTLLQKVASINFAEIAAQWKIDRELAYDLASLALYDIVFYCDDSGSMAFEENGERIDDLKFILSSVSGIATKFDDDGIVVRFMNSDVNGDGIRSAADVVSLISKVRFSGMTPLGTNFDRKIIQPLVIGQATMSSMAKPVLAIIITDGEPSGEDPSSIRRVIQRAKDALTRTRYGGGAFAVQIAQVGKDARTQKFLESLDKDPVVGGMIDCTSYYELEEAEFARKGVTLTPELWLLKMCVGAIDPEYDSKDD